MARTFHLLTRTIPGEAHVQLWLIAVDGPSAHSLLHGEVYPATVDEIAAATGLEVIREVGATLLPPEKKTEKTLFDDTEGS